MKKYSKIISLLCFLLSLSIIILATTGCSNNQKEEDTTVLPNTENNETLQTTENITNAFPEENIQTSYLLKINNKNFDKQKFIKDKSYTQNFLKSSQELLNEDAKRFKQDNKIETQDLTIEGVLKEETSYTYFSYNNNKCKRTVSCGVGYMMNSEMEKEDKLAYNYQHLISEDFLYQNGAEYIADDVEKIFGKLENREEFIQEIENKLETKEENFFTAKVFNTESNTTFSVTYVNESNSIAIIGMLMLDLA